MSRFDPDASDIPVRFVRNRSAAGERSLQRLAVDGEALRIRAGVYADRHEWSDTSHLQRYRARIDAVIGTRRERPVLMFDSAAAVWGLPRLGPWPDAVHLLDRRGTRPRSRNGVIWRQHHVDESEIVEVDGRLVTDLPRTLADLARAWSFQSATMALDAGLRRFVVTPGGTAAAGARRENVLERIEAASSRRGLSRARWRLEFADPAADSPGESLSRANMHVLGFPPPRLQVPLLRPDGGHDIVDFDWPEYGLFGEFDGRGKYTGGRSTADVVLAEKEREDRIRLHHRPRAARWGWDVARVAEALARRLEAAGLPRQRA